jgi:chromosome segregation ATPase
MARRGDNAPIGHTCPKIDSVISSIHSLYLSSEEMSKKEYEDFEKLMEEIRSANSTLREWGNEQCDRAEEFEKDLDNSQREVDYLKNEVEELKSEVTQLEKDLAEAEKHMV